MQPYFKTGAIELYQGDCLQVMPHLEDQSFDFICTDLPYGTLSIEWDKKIDLQKLWAEYKRLIKPSGAIALFGSQPFTSELVSSNQGWFRCEWIWEKTLGGGFLDANKKPLKRHENILIFSSKGEHYYNPQKTKGKAYTCTSAGVGATTADTSVIGWTTKNDGDRYPTTVIRVPNEIAVHPTQKPLGILKYLLKTYSRKGDRVLDSTCGSGSLLVAAKETGRAAVGIELSPEYCEVAKKRLDYMTWAKDNPEKSSLENNGQMTIFAVEVS